MASGTAASTPHDDGTTDSGGEPVLVRLARPAEAPEPVRVLLVHGLCSNSTVWSPFVTRADPRCELWEADMPWRGTGVRDWTLRSVEEWVDLAVSRVPGGVDVLMAHSFGTSTVLSWLDQQITGPHDALVAGGRKLRGAVLVSPLYRATSDDFDWESIAYYLNNFDRILATGMRAHRKAPGVSERQLAVALKVRDFIGPYGWIRFFDTYLRMPQIRTRQMPMPFLIVGGERDFVAFPTDARALGASLPDASVHILPRNEHFPMVASAESFASLTNTFLRSLSA
ncbi:MULTISPECIES: alpha/beta hydrolase [unclassified Streptomyces]|uniref:alpha/beta fold hydrolase n=1 Tax=unclassified Streptomyces TaxID=2593676 RepID=UPI002DDAE60B|nr:MULTISPECIES: alpha/beta hydrolase [unclassified Streptomyces]WSA90506.1 alpha/beta hydrolase [Streptomyces sp. NBC_01795]WSB74831.1 alpha/beta hydrolase [Streptomyces sp. NBC_01775]WSS16886.1 alpha/beta hydrolase [Streptomyces sp. NBC_01186]WSS45629.1 alpha/beta hydrolase [Streptomyces sp. NBC_01187]